MNHDPTSAITLASFSDEEFGSCSINTMLWNWNNIGKCLIFEGWYIGSAAKFIITCVGAVLVTMLFEFLGRVSREWERHKLARNVGGPQESYVPLTGIELAPLQPAAAQPDPAQPADGQSVGAQSADGQSADGQSAHAQSAHAQSGPAQSADGQSVGAQSADGQPGSAQSAHAQPMASRPASASGPGNDQDASAGLNAGNNDGVNNNGINAANRVLPLFPSRVEHALITTLLRTLQLVINYFLILMAVSFNGYIIICIFIGHYLGFLLFGRDPQTESNKPNAYQRVFQHPIACCNV
ncbi:Copper transport ctr4 [Fusarium agapanthi]|uniref:Copper transport protein n=1 Tax=Fusarium agapanthi TaxID=1803897 RepID=A0A9P5E4L2_9HYPO|nr:Copper transport ctr4 [Fusarium agapanthi]